MRIGILSDTHNEFELTRRAVEVLFAEGANAFVHCGDLSTPAIVEMLPPGQSWFVLGNHDADSVADLTSAANRAGVICLGWGGVVDLANKRIGVAHGHLSSDIRRVLDGHPEFFLFGHTHFPSDTTVGVVRKINPGALHRTERPTVAVLDLSSGELRSIALAAAF